MELRFVVERCVKVVPESVLRVVTWLSVAFICSSMVSCAQAPARSERPALTTLNATLLVERAGRVEGEWHYEDILPYFGFIPGSIFGSPIEGVVLPVEVDEQLRVVVDLAEWSAAADAAARPLTEFNRERGVRIRPADARLLRMSTFAHDFRHDSGMSGGLEDEARTGHIILIYVDRPCFMFGSFWLPDGTYAHDIDLPTAGFHYLFVDENKRVTRQVDPTGVLFVTRH